MTSERTTVPDDVMEQLQKLFSDFGAQSEALSRAYAAMQEDFRKVNIELDRRNRELAESLTAQEETRVHLNSILESMSNGVVSVDVEGVITQFNRAAAEITGHDAGSVPGRNYSDVFGESGSPEQGLVSVLQSGKAHLRDEKVLWCVDGSPVPVSFQSAVLKDSSGRRLGAVEIFTDISRLKALEEEMQQTKTMAALGEMAATVAHEIRNPLGAMGVWAGLLDRDFDREDPRRRTLGRIVDALARLNRIVSNLLVYSRPVRADSKKVVLQDLLGETVDFIGIEAERTGQDVVVKKEWDGEQEVCVMADPERLQQVVMNLCLNAVQAMEDGGVLTVSCEGSGARHKGYVSFTIADTGVGIEPEGLDRIFDPFHTTKEKGTGLGLAIVKKLVEHYSGYLKVKSTPGKGTAVRVFLPEALEKGAA